MQARGETRVYIVEDSPHVREALVELLSDLDDVTVAGQAEDAQGAIAAIPVCQPDFVVLDYQLAGGTGLEVLHAIRESTPESKYIVLTNHATSQHRRICMEAGADWFLDKQNEFERVRDIVAHS
jgi:DNA-binding NarL/FixJ family response regulator